MLVFCKIIISLRHNFLTGQYIRWFSPLTVTQIASHIYHRYACIAAFVEAAVLKIELASRMNVNYTLHCTLIQIIQFQNLFFMFVQVTFWCCCWQTSYYINHFALNIHISERICSNIAQCSVFFNVLNIHTTAL